MRIKGWEKFQHFKDRLPPWIKLYRELLDDPDWHDLDDKSAKILVMLWLVASEDKEKEGRLPCVRKLAFRLRLREDVLSKHLQILNHWLEQDDIKMISDCYQDDAPETETEGETEGETDIMSGQQPRQRIPFKAIVSFLNEATGRNYSSSTKATQQKIRARWNEGFTQEDFEKVITSKCSEWLNDSKMVDYLRPETLFGPKFESYLQSASQQNKGYQW